MTIWILMMVLGLLGWVLLAPTAATANRNVSTYTDAELRSFPVAAAVHIYKDAFVGINPAGYLKPHVPGDELVGIATGECDNSSGAAGAESCEVKVMGDFQHTLASVAQADVGKPVFATDDNTLALTGHPDSFVGRVLHKDGTSLATIRLKRFGELPPNGVGSVELRLTGSETFEPTGAASTSKYLSSGFIAKSILGLGVMPNDAEDGGVKFQFDAVAEVALASLRAVNATFPVDKGITMEFGMCLSDKGDAAAIDVDIGLGTALTTNSEADIDHADMAQLAAIHLDGASDNILAQSDDATTDVAVVDTTIDNDSTTDVAKRFKIVVRPTGAVEFWINGARVLSSTAFALLSTAVVAPFVNMEKTSDDTTGVLLLTDLRVAGGKAA